MATPAEHADILGGPILQRPESGIFTTFSRYHLVFKLVAFLGVGLLVWIACTRGLEYLKKHRELRHRKAMRRKHGIPDSDCRPFAVAYAAVKRAHLEREAQDRKKATNHMSDQNFPAVDQRLNAPQDVYLLRKRVPETAVQLRDRHVFGKHATVYDSKRPGVHALDFTDRYHPDPRHRMALPEPLPAERPPVHHAGRKGPCVSLDNTGESRKRSFEEENDVERETLKKSRMDGDELVDGDESADWYAQYSNNSSRRPTSDSLDRQPEGSRVHADGQGRSGRVDEFRNEDHGPGDMEGVDEDKVTELKAVARGKKRDQAEAGSTFGGDDDEDIRNGRVSHHRKRRTISGRTEIPERGQKRDREVESPEIEGDAVDPETSGRRTSKKKRGKKATSDDISEMSLEDPLVSKDPLCGGRRIGDSWEADGVQYMVGDKGKRLRLALVRKARNKYHMPQDSQHPDRSAALEIYVETWMTEEQYEQVEVKQNLAWQEAPKESSGSKPPDVLGSPTKNGKNLLWDSVKCSPVRRLVHQSMPPAASNCTNPFDQWQSQHISARRVASSSTIVSPILAGVVDSPIHPGFRGFSKWEKQDREAEAMTRIRAKMEEQKKTLASSQKLVESPTTITGPELSSKPLSVPTITLTPAPVAEGKLDVSTPSSRLGTSTFSFATQGTAAAGPTTTSLPPSSTSVSDPTSTLSPSAPAALPPSGTLSPFTSTKSSQVPLAATQPSALPNTFGKATKPSLSTPTASALGAMTQAQHPPSSESASKPVLFSFSKPDISSSSPAMLAPPVTEPQPPIFNATSGSSTSPATLGFNSVIPKVETPAPPPALAPTAMVECSKPMAPLFSFSGAPSLAPTSSAPSAPKMFFGPQSTGSTSTPGSNAAAGTASQSKPTFKFGQTPDGTPAIPIADEPKTSAMPTSTLDTIGGPNGLAKPSPFEATTSGSSSFKPPSTNPFGKPVAADSGTPTSAPLKPHLPSTNATTSDGPISSTPPGRPAPAAPIFSFGGVNSTSKPGEGTKPASLFGAEDSNTTAILGGNPTEGRSMFAFGTSTDTPKPPSLFGGNIATSKAPSSFGNSIGDPKPVFAFSSSAEGLKPTFVFSGPAENKAIFPPAAEIAKPTPLSATPSDGLKPFNTTDPSKAIPASGNTASGPFSSPSFTFARKDDTATVNTSNSTSTLSFKFGASSGPTGSAFSQLSAFATSGDSSQSVFGKPTNVTSGAFGFAGTGGSDSSSTFTFNKPAPQNQK